MIAKLSGHFSRDSSKLAVIACISVNLVEIEDSTSSSTSLEAFPNCYCQVITI